MNYGNHATLSENAIKSNLILILNKILKIASFFNHSFNCLEKAIVALVCLLFLLKLNLKLLKG